MRRTRRVVHGDSELDKLHAPIRPQFGAESSVCQGHTPVAVPLREVQKDRRLVPQRM
jgi:hypothetical protein